MKREMDQDRRKFIQWTSMAGSSFVLSACMATHPKESDEKKSSAENKEADVSPAEDLMREHGVLDRVLLIYDEGLRRLALQQELDPGVLASSAGIVRRFIEDYHEKLEENYLFPRFEKAGKLGGSRRILRKHQAGRRIYR
ncbi:MAG: hemerythrin domain-containing protein [Terriglobia bacterium]